MKHAAALALALVAAGAAACGPAMRDPVKPGVSPRAAAGDALLGCRTMTRQGVSPTERLWATTAWRYVEANTDEVTGVVNGTDRRGVASMWDVADTIASTYAALELGLIDTCAFDARIGKVMGFLNTMPLVDDIAPNRSYNTTTRAMVNAAGQPAVVGWSSADIGRLLIWLRALEVAHPAWSEYVGRAVARWNFCSIIDAEGTLTGGTHQGPGDNRVARDAGLGYEEYAAAGFTLWGFDTKGSASLDPSEDLTVGGVDLRRDQRDLATSGVTAPLTTTPFAAFEMEFGGRLIGSPWATYRELGRSVARAQYQRFELTRTLTARTFRPLAAAPWFVYDSVWAEGYTWNAMDPKGASVPDLALLSTAAAFELWAAYPDATADRLIAAVGSLQNTQRGWFAGRVERTGATDTTLTLRTNAAVLEALLFRSAGSIMGPKTEPTWFEVNSRDEFFRPGRCLPGERRRTADVLAGPPVAVVASGETSQAIPAGVVTQLQSRAIPEKRSHGFSVTPAIDIPLTYGFSRNGAATQGEESTRSPRLSLNVRYTPFRSFFGRVGAYVYLDRSRKAPWNPDFTYSFGYESWRPGTFALTYDNYGGNRLNPNRARGERFTHFDEGTITASYKIPVTERIESLFVSFPEKRITSAIAFHATPRYHLPDGLTRGEWKRAASFSLRTRLWRWFYVEGRALYYPWKTDQQPWDPDFTYGFGYFDWHSGTVSVQYNNYAPSRFSWNHRPRGASLRDGGLTISTTWVW